MRHGRVSALQRCAAAEDPCVVCDLVLTRSELARLFNEFAHAEFYATRVLACRDGCVITSQLVHDIHCRQSNLCAGRAVSGLEAWIRKRPSRTHIRTIVTH